MNHCAPDLPFLQTIVWYLKQIGAVFSLMVLAVLTIALLLVLKDVYTVLSRRANGKK